MAKINGDQFSNEIDGTNGRDTIYGKAGNDEIDGNWGADKLYGGAGNDELDGDRDNDTLEGGEGNDELDGGQGDDVLRGGKGDDEIVGDDGNDMLFGGKGFDVFQFDSREGQDTIGDFKSGQDRIEFDIDNLSFGDLSIRNNGQGDAVITWGDPTGASITLDGVKAGQLSNNDFIFDS